MVFVLILLLVVLGGANYYIALRIYQGLRHIFPNLRLWPVLCVIFLLLVIMMLGFSRSFLPVSAGVKHVLGVICAYWMGLFIYLLLFTVAADLFLLICRLFRFSFTGSSACRFAAAIVIVFLSVGTVCYGAIHARQIKHVSYDVSLSTSKTTSEMNIVMISDLHLGAIGSEGRLEKIVQEINAQKPDIVCIAGDFFDTDYASIRNPDQAIDTLRRISAVYGVYACLGNHDSGKTLASMTEFLERCNIRLLNDEYVVIDQRLVLVGRLDSSPIGGYGSLNRKELSDVLSGADTQLPVVVLDHNPANIHDYGSETDLILSGHTHKGQLFPANLITDLMYTVDHGYYRKDGNSPHVIVSSGVGAWGMPLRVGSDCEIVTIRFQF